MNRIDKYHLSQSALVTLLTSDWTTSQCHYMPTLEDCKPQIVTGHQEKKLSIPPDASDSSTQMGDLLLVAIAFMEGHNSFLLATSAGTFASATKSCPQSRQSSPKSSNGCCVRSDPLPHFIESAAQYRSQPQQIRSGLAGCSGNFFISCRSRNLVPAGLRFRATRSFDLIICVHAVLGFKFTVG